MVLGDDDGLGCAFQWAAPAHRHAPNLRQDQKAIIEPCAIAILLEDERMIALASLEAREARCLPYLDAAKERLIGLV